MTERERWVIYPLLFLALGAALRDKLFDLTNSKRIVCEQMMVVADELAGNQQRELVLISEMPGVKVNGRSFGAIEVDGIIRAHGIETDGMLKAQTVYADNFVFRGISFGPAIFQAAPGVTPGDWLRALQQSAEAAQQGAAGSAEDADAPDPGQSDDESPSPDAGVQ